MDVDFEQEVIANKMRSRVDTIVSNQQYAKRSSVSTTDALLQLTDDWTEVLDQDKAVKFVQNACLDFSKRHLIGFNMIFCFLKWIIMILIVM